PDDVAELDALATWAKDHKLKPHAEMASALALAQAPADAPALAGLGADRFAALKRGNVLLDPDLLATLRTYVAEPEPAKRSAVGDELLPRPRGAAGRDRRLPDRPRGGLGQQGQRGDGPRRDRGGVPALRRGRRPHPPDGPLDGRLRHVGARPQDGRPLRHDLAD